VFGTAGGLLASLIVWGLGYSIALFMMDRLLTLIFRFPAVKQFLNMPFFKRIRDEINPLTIFPLVLSAKGVEKMKQAGIVFKKPPMQ
ncbi:MAG: hypothetical protein LLG37_07500, partial [Spirochaetia bacterium]|nr:hypothetical protein [Spirochaetia bacterium]